MNHKSEIQLQVNKMLSFMDWDEDSIVHISNEISDVYELCITRFSDQLNLDMKSIKQLVNVIISKGDIERIFVLPSMSYFLADKKYELTKGIYAITDYKEQTFSKRWETSQYNLFLVWMKLTMFDMRSDGVDLSEFSEISFNLDKLIPRELDGHIYMIKDSYDKFHTTEFGRIADYAYFLIDRYASYGEYVSESLKKALLLNLNDVDEVSYIFSNILVLAQMLDDAADWAEDSLNDNVSWIANSMRDEFPDLSSRTKLETSHKEYYLLHLAGEFMEYVKKYTDESAKFTLHDKILEGFLKNYVLQMTSGVSAY